MKNIFNNITLSLMLISTVTFCNYSSDDANLASTIADEYIAITAAGCLYESIVLMNMQVGFKEWQEYLKYVSSEEREEFNYLKEVFDVRFALDNFADICDLRYNASKPAVQVTLLELFSVYIPNPTVINLFIALGCDFSMQKNSVLKQITQELKRLDLWVQDRQNMIECQDLLLSVKC